MMRLILLAVVAAVLSAGCSSTGGDRPDAIPPGYDADTTPGTDGETWR